MRKILAQGLFQELHPPLVFLSKLDLLLCHIFCFVASDASKQRHALFQFPCIEVFLIAVNVANAPQRAVSR